MIIDRKNALKLWENAYGKVVEALDFSGRKINKSAYGQKNSKYGWTVTLLLPKSEGGKEQETNFICAHIDTAEEKGDNFPFFVACDKKYEIKIVEDNSVTIEEATDSESIAEQQAKIAAAMERWDALFGAEYEKAMDFCGREIHKSEYATESEFAWKIAPYVDSKPMDSKNAYIASVLSVEEAFGKTAFKANGKNYTLNKDNGSYYFKAIEVKAPKKAFDVRNPYDMVSRLEEIKLACSGDENVMLDFLVIRAVTRPGCSAGVAQSVTEAVSDILRNTVGGEISCELSEMADEQGTRYMFITYRFVASQPADFEKIFASAQLLNTYAPLLTPSLGLVEFKIYNYASYINRAHLHFPVGMLSGYYPQFGSMMNAIYGSAYGFYAGEAVTTLYVSHLIVFNVPFLAQMHPQESAQYFTDAYLVEHNYVEPELANSIYQMFSAAKSETSESEVAESETPESETSESVTTDSETNEVVDSQSVTTDNDTNEVVDSQSGEEQVASIAPLTEETVVEEPTTPVAEEVVVEEIVAPATEETVVEEPTTPVAEEVVVEETIAPAADGQNDIVRSSDTQDKTEVEVSIAPVTEETVVEEHQIAKTPEGEQLTMAFPTMNAQNNESAEEEEDILTIDFDALD